MGLLSIFQRKNGPGVSAAEPQDAVTVAAARRRARRRLVGAVVLVLAGVVGFPLLFDTAPRPLPVDIPIEIPRKDNAPPLVDDPSKRIVKGDVAPSEPQVAPSAPTAATQPKAPELRDDKPAEKVIEKPAEKPAEAKPEPTPAAAPSAKPSAAADAARAQAALEGKPAAAAKPDLKPKPEEVAVKPSDAASRFVVQVGAFSEAESARDARSRVEKLGFKTYTQSVDTAAGKRIRVRVGPYDDRAEAEKVAAKIKQAGIAAAVRAP